MSRSLAFALSLPWLFAFCTPLRSAPLWSARPWLSTLTRSPKRHPVRKRLPYIVILSLCMLIFASHSVFAAPTKAERKDPCADLHDTALRQCREKEGLKYQLLTTQEELQYKEAQLNARDREHEATLLRNALQQEKVFILREEWDQEWTYRRQSERRYQRLTGNLLYPGWGQIRLKENRGFLWSVLFTVSAAATLYSYKMQSDATHRALSGFDPFQSNQAAYLRAYDRTQALLTFSVAVYSASVLDAYLSDRLPPPPSLSVGRDFSQADIRVSLRF